MVLTWENKSRVPDIYFAWSEGFDYRKYVEEKSHFDEVVLAVDRSTTELIGSADRLTHRIGEGVQILSGSIDQVGQVMEKGFSAVVGQLKSIDDRLEGIDDTLNAGFSAISFNLEAIDSSIQDLSVICDLGFDKVAAQTAKSNELLEDLISLIKTPDQVWAREQYEYAKECMSRDLWEDALSFSDKAISGDDRNSGLYIEPAFHFLRGDILLHYPEVGEGNEFVEKALQSFMDGAKYCGKKRDELKALCLLRASWCHYCLGDRATAIDHARTSQELHSTPLTAFHLAKYLSSSGEKEAAIELEKAILDDELFYIRALNDSDFNNGLFNLEESAKNAKEKRMVSLQSYKTDYLGEKFISSIIEICERLGISNQYVSSLKATLKYTRGIEADGTLSSLNGFLLSREDNDNTSAAEKLKQTAHEHAGLLEKEITRSIERLEKSSFTPQTAHVRPKEIASHKYSFVAYLICLGAIALLFVIFTGWPIYFSVVVGGVVGFFLAIFISGPVENALLRSAKNRAAEEADRERQSKQVELDRQNAQAQKEMQSKKSLGHEAENRLQAARSLRSALRADFREIFA